MELGKASSKRGHLSWVLSKELYQEESKEGEEHSKEKEDHEKGLREWSRRNRPFSSPFARHRHLCEVIFAHTPDLSRVGIGVGLGVTRRMKLLCNVRW